MKDNDLMLMLQMGKSESVVPTESCVKKRKRYYDCDKCIATKVCEALNGHGPCADFNRSIEMLTGSKSCAVGECVKFSAFKRCKRKDLSYKQCGNIPCKVMQYL